jgi:2-oxoglutarate dehydrogenase E1 component
MVGDTYFQRYLPETSEEPVRPEDIRRHILCSGKVFDISRRGNSKQIVGS